jgi:hypothetical protein
MLEAIPPPPPASQPTWTEIAALLLPSPLLSRQTVLPGSPQSPLKVYFQHTCIGCINSK